MTGIKLDASRLARALVKEWIRRRKAATGAGWALAARMEGIS